MFFCCLSVLVFHERLPLSVFVFWGLLVDWVLRFVCFKCVPFGEQGCLVIIYGSFCRFVWQIVY